MEKSSNEGSGVSIETYHRSLIAVFYLSDPVPRMLACRTMRRLDKAKEVSPHELDQIVIHYI